MCVLPLGRKTSQNYPISIRPGLFPLWPSTFLNTFHSKWIRPIHWHSLRDKFMSHLHHGKTPISIIWQPVSTKGGLSLRNCNVNWCKPQWLGVIAQFWFNKLQGFDGWDPTAPHVGPFGSVWVCLQEYESQSQRSIRHWLRPCTRKLTHIRLRWIFPFGVALRVTLEEQRALNL